MSKALSEDRLRLLLKSCNPDLHQAVAELRRSRSLRSRFEARFYKYRKRACREIDRLSDACRDLQDRVYKLQDIVERSEKT